MSLDLKRIDYTKVGTTSRHLMKLLPSSTKQQKVALADNDGLLQVFGIKKGEIQTMFKTHINSRVTSLALGGQVGGPRDRIFISSGTQVRAFTKKGKNFLNFNSPMSETIQNIAVDGVDLFVCGDFVYNHFHDCRDVGRLLCVDRISDILCLPSSQVGEVTPVLSCEDGVLRTVKGSNVLTETDVSGSPTCMHLLSAKDGEEGGDVLYGTKDGRVGLVQIGKFGSSTHRWELSNGDRRGGVLCVDSFDITSDGTPDLILGRDDGQVEIYSFDEADEPVLRFGYTCPDSVTAVQGGFVLNPDYEEVVCSTYAGWVFGLTSENVSKRDNSASFSMDAVTAEKISSLKSELDTLQGKLFKERERYQNSAQSNTAVSAIPVLEVNDKFMLNKEDASYSLTIELQTSIDHLLLQSDVPVDLLDVEKNSAVVSFSAHNHEDGNYLLATYRCQANTTRLELRIRSIEGQCGSLKVYITPRLQPKTCQLKTYDLKPLSLHRRTHAFDAAGRRCIMVFRKGEAVFRSDNLSTVSILKDVLSKKATSHKINVNFCYDISEESVPHTLALIHPRLEYQLSLAKNVQLIDALQEIEVNESGTDLLSADYRKVLENADNLKTEFKRQPSQLERLYGIVTDLFIDKFKFKGQNVKQKVPALLEVLDEYEYNALCRFFETPS